MLNVTTLNLQHFLLTLAFRIYGFGVAVILRSENVAFKPGDHVYSVRTRAYTSRASDVKSVQ